MNAKIFFLSLCSFLFGISFAFGQAPSAFLMIHDSTAGEENIVRVGGLFSQEKVTLRLARPDATQVEFPIQADADGSLQYSIYGLHLRTAGNYDATLSRASEEVHQSFRILPGAVSAYTSTTDFEKLSVAADGEEEARFTVSLRDAFSNPVPHKSAMVVSSRNEDLITSQKETDDTGKFTGKIQSRTPGVSTISVFSGDAVLFSKPQIVFFLSGSSLLNVGSSGTSYGEFLKAQLFDENQGDVSFFTLEDIKTDVMVGETITVKAVAKDTNSNVVSHYTGTVRFSSSDDRANLPEDYTFTSEDQGMHTFFLAVAFQTPGDQTLAVHDLNDFRKSGEVKIRVTMGDTPLPPPTTPGITLLTPRPGTYRSSRVTITGQAVGIKTIRLQDGNTILTDNLAVDAQGNFVYQTPALAEGIHSFQAFDTQSDSTTSSALQIQIDQTASGSVSVTVDPQGVLQSEQEFQVHVHSDEPLSAASVLFDGVLTSLLPSGDEFVGHMTAPKSPGEYPVDVTVTDLLGNEAQHPKAGMIQVVGGDTGADTLPPSLVTNVSAQSGDSKVTLFWSPASDNQGVHGYRIEFAELPLDSDPSLQPAPNSFTQFNLTPDDRTQWYVDKLGDDKKYYFRVLAVDNAGNMGTPSDVIPGFTSGAVQPVATPKTGSGVILPFVIALALSGGIYLFLRRS